jgi:hypothetical protein
MASKRGQEKFFTDMPDHLREREHLTLKEV